MKDRIAQLTYELLVAGKITQAEFVVICQAVEDWKIPACIPGGRTGPYAEAQRSLLGPPR